MIQSQITNCKECLEILPLIDKIDCKIFQQSIKAYNNIIFGLNLNINYFASLDLLNYKRILNYRLNDPKYAGCQFTSNMIASKVALLTAGCKKNCNCDELNNTPPVISTTTTSTTLNPLAGDFTIGVGAALLNSINSVTPIFYSVLTGSFPVQYGDSLIGKLVSGGTTISINYSCTEGTPQLIIYKNGIPIVDEPGLPMGTNLNYVYDFDWEITDDIIVSLNLAP